MSQIGRWGLVAFFFFGGIAFVSFEPTREIWIGQIWIAVSILVAAVYVLTGVGGQTFDLSRWRGGTTQQPTVSAGAPALGANTAATQLERLEKLHREGDLTDAEYQAQRDRIISEAS